jgi:Zn finger protein HypA/HybF involved in hydrogenase expression
MSLQGERQKTHDIPMSVVCWRCHAPMKIKTIAPAMLSQSLDEVVYRCPACHIERKQTVMRAD